MQESWWKRDQGFQNGKNRALNRALPFLVLRGLQAREASPAPHGHRNSPAHTSYDSVGLLGSWPRDRDVLLPLNRGSSPKRLILNPQIFKGSPC